ncbi:uncharacterized protein I303_106189 [Kwoniella dejecticola CBS 10117]|uniref:WSC domain-containing protein n=1 Tax=Kwoniella dejecticola CBS 10117 TaxID=1296121 RepID=A0A1A6A1I4_9TREE|nr:uncharacterized protein I303_06207 [Kwoniella dejecticola CBS 10117]OBR83921.1 hypothetical protein I303_06207 [Kwoniella dejecticola CBS 10117]
MLASFRYSTLFLLAIMIVLTCVRSHNLFIGCGDGLGDIEYTGETVSSPNKDNCYNVCTVKNYNYYTYKAPSKQCVCYLYPPPAAEYMPGGPGSCGGNMQYNLIKSSWRFSKCYASPPDGLLETPTDSFKACMDSCKPNETALAKPTEIYPGQTNCICTSKAKLNGLGVVQCGYQRYYAYQHQPNTRRDSRAIAIAGRHAEESESNSK